MAEETVGETIGAVKRLYFAGHHFTRDLIGTISPLTAASVVFVSYYIPARVAALSLYEKYAPDTSFWAFVGLLIVYLISSYFVGCIANILGNFLHRIWQNVRKESSYGYWYQKDSEKIDMLYRKFFPGFEFVSSGALVSPTDKVNVMKEYFRRTNPGGYIETYRQFLKVDIVRTTVLYALILFGFSLSHVIFGHPSSYIGVLTVGSIALAAILAWSELPRRVRKVVRAEYQFIIATAQLKQDMESRAART